MISHHFTLVILVASFAFPQIATARDTPASYGEAARVDTPIIRIPMMKKAPEIDGVLAPGEWEDASALTGFWYDFSTADFRYLAPVQTQLQVYLAYDKDNLYYAFTSPIYPKNSWMKARGRFPDVLNHPLYGILWDDHIELEFRPHDDLVRGFQLGLLRFDVNPINTYVDWYWSHKTGMDRKWKSNAKIRSSTANDRWVIEFAIPHKSMLYGLYGEKDEQGRPWVQVPPPDGTIYRTWLVRGIGGNGKFFNAFDNHAWNTTKTQIIFDSQAPSFQVNELGPIMEDVIDVKMTIKNHATRSQTVLLGFFVESAAGTIYSSYDSPDMKDGLLELVPGEVKQLRLRQPFPGITSEDNVLWFDVRSAGQPAKQLFRTRLIRFHSMDGGTVSEQKMIVEKGKPDPKIVVTEIPFKERRLDVIAEMRPPRLDFDFRWNFSSYTKKVSAVVDKGLHGASEEARSAVEAKLFVLKDNVDEDEVKAASIKFKGNFAVFMLDLQELVDGEKYKLSLLLFDENRRIVGERNPDPFTFHIEEWQHNKIGLDDVVWEPFTPIQKTADGFSTLQHYFRIASSGLPEQLIIKPDIRELPLEARAAPASVSDAALLAVGRGPQLRKPVRFEVVVNGKREQADVVESAKVVRQWKSEIVYEATMKAGPLSIALSTRYDCDGSMHCTMNWGTDQPVEVELFELVTEVAGLVDMGFSETGGGGMTGADRWEIALPEKEGVIWDSSETQMELFYSKFVPWFWFGSGDRAWSWYCDRDQGWLLDKEGSTMQLERNKDGDVTWRVQFVNHTATVLGQRKIDFSLLTHPAKPKPVNNRIANWHYFQGDHWAAGYGLEPIDLPDEYLIERWRQAASAPKEMAYEKAVEWRKDEPPYFRYGQWRNVGVCEELDQTWEDKATYYFERHIRVGRRVGWWMDEYFPVAFGRSENLAAGNAYLRNPEQIQGDELPWQSGFLTTTMRNHYKRIARVSAKNNVPQRQHTWSNNCSNMLESFIYSSLLVEECGAGHRSYDIDVVTQFPISLYRFMCKPYTGLVTTVCADSTPERAGGNKRLDRQHFGRALLNDIGVSPSGPHGIIHHKEQGLRVLDELSKFGFFNDENTERLPYWRNESLVRIGDKPSDQSQIHTTIYRRPLDDGQGYKAIFVIMNETNGEAELPITISDTGRILGGSNTLKAGPVRLGVEMPEGLGDWWSNTATRDQDAIVLQDLETGEAIPKAGAGETYGPVFLPYHDFRLLYAESRQ
ncbi:MAG: DUF6067 family protein [Planctomycetota bacterium]|nr:DUF6067 family protein [Planctomycetota bacterium]